MTINAKLVHVYQLTDPVEGRQTGAWVIEYRGQAFLTDPGGGSPEPFTWGGQARRPIESRARAKAPATGFDVMSREDIARALRVNPALLSFVEHGERGFPNPRVPRRTHLGRRGGGALDPHPPAAGRSPHQRAANLIRRPLRSKAVAFLPLGRRPPGRASV